MKIALLLVLVLLIVAVVYWQRDTWQHFESHDGVRLAYLDEGEGTTLILLHGFMVDSDLNWREPGLLQALQEAGFRTVALDARGHGRSHKPHEASAYADQAMAKDVQALIDHLVINTAILVGYSMGGNTALETALRDSRIAALIAGGIHMPSAWDDDARTEEVAAMRADTIDPNAFYRSIAEQVGGDRLAYAARLEGSEFPEYSASELQTLNLPVLLINGDKDLDQSGALGQHIHGVQQAVVPGDHVSAHWTLEFRQQLLAFLNRQKAPDKS